MKDITVKEYIQSVIKTLQKNEFGDVILNITGKSVHPSSIQINLTRHIHPSFSLNKLIRWQGEPISIQNLLELRNFDIVTLVVKADDYIQTKNQLIPEHQALSINPEALRIGSDPIPVSRTQRKLFNLEELSLIKKIEHFNLDEKKASKPPLLPPTYNQNYFIQPKKPVPIEFATRLSEKIEIHENYFQASQLTDNSFGEEIDSLEDHMNTCSSDRWRRNPGSY